MQPTDLDRLRYPIGVLTPGVTYSDHDTQEQLSALNELPSRLSELVGKWGDDRLDTPYRPGGWTVRQLVHHVADSHLNAYVRTKLALTENTPTIKPYEEGEWAKLPDSQLDVAPSLVLLRNLHVRWVAILSTLTPTDLARVYLHPATQRTVSLRDVIALYAWHGEHHYQHAFRLAERNSWLKKNV